MMQRTQNGRGRYDECVLQNKWHFIYCSCQWKNPWWCYQKSIIDVAKKEGIEVDVRPVLVSELVEASKDGTLKEIFGAGTAAVVNPIIGFSYQDVYYELPKIENSYAVQLKIN
jgi:hypothetical protein